MKSILRSDQIRLSFLVLCILIILTACGRQRPVANTDPIPADATPTSLPSPSPEPSATPLPPTPSPTVARPTSTPHPTSDDPLAGLDVVRIPVYADELEDGWSLEQSNAVTYELESTAFVDKGDYAIQIKLDQATGVVYFTFDADSIGPLLRNKVQGLQFRLTGGDEIVTNDALAVAVIGSNKYESWVAGDTSVQIDGRVTEDLPLFSETRLYYLNITRSIPEKTWVDVVVWLDELIYDPEYTYVTGFYLKTEENALMTFYLDDINLLVDQDAIAP